MSMDSEWLSSWIQTHPKRALQAISFGARCSLGPRDTAMENTTKIPVLRELRFRPRLSMPASPHYHFTINEVSHAKDPAHNPVNKHYSLCFL